MGKKSRTRNATANATVAGEVGPRQPCPCGSGRRYKACHGSPGGPPLRFVSRPFEGLDLECDLVALREFVPAATVPLQVREAANTDVTLCTLLPGAAPSLVREDGSVLLALQVQHAYGDPSRDLGAVLTEALAQAGAGNPGMVGLASAPGEGDRLQELIDGFGPVAVHEGFDFWGDDAALAPVLEQANSSAAPSARLDQPGAAYWTAVSGKEFVRWVFPDDEDTLLDALARLHVAGTDRLGADSRLIGMFRAHGLVVPVWELPAGTGAAALEDPATELAESLARAKAETGALDGDLRAARAGLTSRQVSIRQ